MLVGPGVWLTCRDFAVEWCTVFTIAHSERMYDASPRDLGDVAKSMGLTMVPPAFSYRSFSSLTRLILMPMLEEGSADPLQMMEEEKFPPDSGLLEPCIKIKARSE
jgi:hypothetical protein